MAQKNPSQRLQEGEKKIEKYVLSLKNVLGRGSYATVYLGRNTKTAEQVAVKVIEKKVFANQYNLKNIQQEIEIMKKIEGENIVALLDLYQTANNMYIVTQFCQDGDLRNYIKSRKKLPENQAIRFLKDIVTGFRVLDEANVIHRDLKPANILLSEGRCKIADFGFAKSIYSDGETIMSSVVGTPLYMSPQILNNLTYTKKSDLWSVGLIFYEMLHGSTPWPANTEMQLLGNIKTKPLTIDPNLSERTKDFLRRSLRIKEEDRMSWDETYAHPLLKEQYASRGVSPLGRINIQERINREERRERSGTRSKSRSRGGISTRTPRSRKPPSINVTTPENKCGWKI